MRPDHVAPVDAVVSPHELIRQRLDLWNRRFVNLSADLDRTDSTLAEAIGEHPDNTSHRMTMNSNSQASN